MKVLVDTSVWSLALRKNKRTIDEEGLTVELTELIREMRVEIIGPIRQELLSGIRERRLFDHLKEKLQGFEDLPLEERHSVKAAECFNQCRAKGIQGSHIDFLICAAALLEGLAIFTSDRDFFGYARELDLRLHDIRR